MKFTKAGSKKKLVNALMSAFRDKQALDMLTQLELEIPLNTIDQAARTYQESVLSLVNWAESHNKVVELVIAASRENPGNPELQQFVFEHLKDLQVRDDLASEIKRVIDHYQFEMERPTPPQSTQSIEETSTQFPQLFNSAPIMTSISAKPIKVFISYSHDSQEHKARVLALSVRLRKDGVDANIDQYEESPSEGWPRWMMNQVEEADYVLVICTETYDRRFRGKEERGRGKGGTWEGAIITQELYDDQGRNEKFIPVTLTSADSDHIPQPLKSATYYRPYQDEGYELLYRRLTNQPDTPRPELGTLKTLPPRERKQSFPDEEQIGKKF
ncbi:MAG: SEFIR domain-containing protein [Snowella sp.]|nr:SEFIR domain-containing protein [Snowella sp.]